MKRTLIPVGLLALLSVLPCRGQETSPLPESYKAKLDRLAALTARPEVEWRYHADIAHPEDPSLN